MYSFGIIHHQLSKTSMSFMNFQPSEYLSQEETDNGLRLVIKEGVATEAMSVLTGGTFLVAMALKSGASNFQVGLLASLPAFTNVFQLLSIHLVQRYNNRRAIAVICNVMARFPLLVAGALPFIITGTTSVGVLIFLLFFHYFFGSLAGASWNSWMKDLIPETKLGTFFSRRIRLTQTLNVTVSLALALALDYIKKVNPGMELPAFSCLFIGGGIMGLLATYLLSKTPEPAGFLPKENILRLFKKPLVNKNFRNLLLFNSCWAFALNIATPFFSVFMIKKLGLSLTCIITLAILGQLAGIFAVKIWGRYTDAYSNKTILKIAAPLYLLCLLIWTFAGASSSLVSTSL